jgi:hypothetical protein
MSEAKEKFHCAATQYAGKTYIGSIHPLIYEGIKELHPEAHSSDMVEGFATTTGRFLNRKEAKKLAHEQDLVRRGRDKNADSGLWSEYLVEGTLSKPAFKEVA